MGYWMCEYSSEVKCIQMLQTWFRSRHLFGKTTLIARFMGPTWSLPGADRTQVSPMWATWTLISGQFTGDYSTKKANSMEPNFMGFIIMRSKHYVLTIDDSEFPLWVAAIDAGSLELRFIALNNSTGSNLLVALLVTFADLDESVGPSDPKETIFLVTREVWGVFVCWKTYCIIVTSYEHDGVTGNGQYYFR